MGIWKIQFLASSLNLCLLNQLAQVEVKAFCLKIKQDSLGVWLLWNLQKRSFPAVFQMFVKISQYSAKNTCVGVSF